MVALAALAPAACADDPQVADDGGAAAARLPGTVIEAAEVNAAIHRLPEFARLATALDQTGVGAEIAAMPAVTLLAPRDSAFAQLEAGARGALFAPANQGTLRAALRALIVPRRLRAAELRQQIDDAGGTLSLPTLAGPPLSLTRQGEWLVMTTPGGATATLGAQEIAAGNGAVYVLDRWPGPVPVALPAAAAPLTPIDTGLR